MHINLVIIARSCLLLDLGKTSTCAVLFDSFSDFFYSDTFFLTTKSIKLTNSLQNVIVLGVLILPLIAFQLMYLLPKD